MLSAFVLTIVLCGQPLSTVVFYEGNAFKVDRIDPIPQNVEKLNKFLERIDAEGVAGIKRSAIEIKRSTNNALGFECPGIT